MRLIPSKSSSTFSIHQFSSGIINPQQNEKGTWVSGGYGKEIDKESFPVPAEIRKAVNTSSKHGWRGFGIPDAYPPPMGEFALIARELKNYYVLAVANQQQDNSYRPFIAYRYFWLKKEEHKGKNYFHDFDGIATLFFHWELKKCPKYNIREWTNDSGPYTKSWTLESLYISQQKCLKDHWERIQKFSTINKKNKSLGDNEPVIYEADEIDASLEAIDVHCLAIKYSNTFNCSINWAWNVRRLENMQDLRVIYYAAPEKKETQTPDTSGCNMAKVPVNKPDTQYHQEKWEIQNFLLNFSSNFTEEEVLKLMDYYRSHRQNIVQFKHEDTIKSFYSEMPKPSDKNIKYATLLVALDPMLKNKEISISRSLMNLNGKLKSEVAIKFLDNLLKIVTENPSCFEHENCQLFCKNFTCIKWQLHDSVTGTIYRIKIDILKKLKNYHFIKNILGLNKHDSEEAKDSGKDITDKTKQIIQNLLQKFCGKFSEKDVFKLMNYYQTYEEYILNFQDKNTTIDDSKDILEHQNIKYKTLLTALDPKEKGKQKILSNLVNSKNNLNKQVAIKLLEKLLMMATLDLECFNHPIYKVFCKKFTYTKFRLIHSLDKIKSLDKNRSMAFPTRIIWGGILFFLLSGVVVAWIYLQPKISITILTKRNGSDKLLGTFEIPPTSTGQQGSLAELLNKYYSQYKAIKILETNNKNNTNNEIIKEFKNNLYEELDGDQRKITKKLTDTEAEQYIKYLKDGDVNQVTNARKQEIYTNLKEFTPKIIGYKLPSLEQRKQNEVNVTALQNALQRSGNYTAGQVNYEPGKFDELTKKAVENLQNSYIKKSTTTQMKKDGVVEAKTWNLLIPRLKDLQVEMVYEILKNHLQLEQQTGYNIVSEIKRCKDTNQNENALEFVNCLEKLNDKP